VERPVLVAVPGGPGQDHMTVTALEPPADDFQVVPHDFTEISAVIEVPVGAVDLGLIRPLRPR
jgi:hypothetical protein